jgi:hypothetical protein
MKRPGFFVVGLLFLFPALLVAQAATSEEGPDSGLRVTHAVGFQYSTLSGFIPAYQVGLGGPFLRTGSLVLDGQLANGFSVLGDMLSATAAARIDLAPALSFSFEMPATIEYRFPTALTASLAGVARLSARNRRDPMDLSPGWLFAADLSARLGSSWTNSTGSSASLSASFPSGASTDRIVPYQAESMIEVGYVGRAWSSGLKLVATDDLTMLRSLGLKGIASVTFGHVLGAVSVEADNVLDAARFNFGVSVGYRF